MTRSILVLLLGVALAAAACEDDTVPHPIDAAVAAPPAADAAREGGVTEAGADDAPSAGDGAGGTGGADARVDAAAADARPDMAAGEGGAADRPATDAAPGSGDAAAPDGPVLTPAQMRGRYLVDVVAGCGGCHTPRLPTGAPDFSKYLAGAVCFEDTLPMTMGMGCVNSRNLTNHMTGLMSRTDAQIKDLFTKGVRPDGKALHAFMPYWEYGNMTSDDADAVVAYLRTVPGINNMIPNHEPPFDQQPATPVPLVPQTDIPAVPAGAPNGASNGRYLASFSCIGCHTMPLPPPGLPYDSTKVFAGGRDFVVPIPGYPAKVYSQNLTQHATGIMGWTADDVVKVLKMGLDKMGKKVCLPMPAGPMGNFGFLTDGDARDIANYIVTLPGKANMLPNQCEAP